MKVYLLQMLKLADLVRKHQPNEVF